MANAFQSDAFQGNAFQVEVSVTVIVSGVSVVGSIGSVFIDVAGATAYPTSVTGYGEIGQVIVWGLIPNNQSPNWVAISDGQSPAWTSIGNAQTPNWQLIAA
jgi:predicted ABC-type sugar transport system permease subunit